MEPREYVAYESDPQPVEVGEFSPPPFMNLSHTPSATDAPTAAPAAVAATQIV